jgi:salicylate hydroxylase
MIYERVRRERTAGVQRMSRLNGARYDAAGGDLKLRDRQLSAQVLDRTWIWTYDAEAAALAAVAAL